MSGGKSMGGGMPQQQSPWGMSSARPGGGMGGKSMGGKSGGGGFPGGGKGMRPQVMPGQQPVGTMGDPLGAFAAQRGNAMQPQDAASMANSMQSRMTQGLPPQMPGQSMASQYGQQNQGSNILDLLQGRMNQTGEFTDERQ